MKVTSMKVIVMVVAFLLFSFQAWANPILLASDPFSVLGNAGDATVLGWLNDSINNYNITHNPDLPTLPPGTSPTVKVITGGPSPADPPYPTFGANTLSIDLPGNLNDYLVLHWGGQFGGIFQAFDLITDPEVLDTFSAPIGANGLSFYSFYGGEAPPPIPEPATMFLLGSGLIGLAGYGRKKFFKK